MRILTTGALWNRVPYKAAKAGSAALFALAQHMHSMYVTHARLSMSSAYSAMGPAERLLSISGAYAKDIPDLTLAHSSNEHFASPKTEPKASMHYAVSAEHMQSICELTCHRQLAARC
jgi:hypothetical protein